MKSKMSKPIWINPLRFICLFVIAGLIYLPLNHFSGSLAMHHGSVPLLILLTLLIIGLSISMLIYMLKEQNKYVTVKYSVKHRIWLVPLGILINALLLFVSGLIMIASHVHLESLNGQALMNINKTHVGSIYLLIMMIIAPIIEEFFFRFLIVGPNPIGNHQINKFVYGFRIAIGIILFGLIHVSHQFFVTGSIVGTLINDLPYLAMGGLFTYLYVHTQDIKVPIAVHIIWDLSLTILRDLI